MPHRAIEQRTSARLQNATPIHLGIGQPCVAAPLARELQRLRGGYPDGDCRARLPSPDAIVEVADLQPRNLHVHIEPVQEGPRDAAAISLRLSPCAAAASGGIAQVTAGTGVHGRNQLEFGRIVGVRGGAGDSHDALSLIHI